SAATADPSPVSNAATPASSASSSTAPSPAASNPPVPRILVLLCSPSEWQSLDASVKLHLREQFGIGAEAGDSDSASAPFERLVPDSLPRTAEEAARLREHWPVTLHRGGVAPGG